MMPRGIKLLLVALVFASFGVAAASASTETMNITDVTKDAMIREYTFEESGGDYLRAGDNSGINYRSWIEFDISTFSGYDITEIKFYYHGKVHDKDCRLIELTSKPSVGPRNEAYWQIGNGTVIADPSGFPQAGPQKVITLNQAGIDSLQAAIRNGQTWWAVGVLSEADMDPNDYSDIYSENYASANPTPTLEVTFEADYSVSLDGLYYENGTRNGGETVTVSTPSGAILIPVNGAITKYYGGAPELIYWDIDGSIRRIYTPFAAENFTITCPDDVEYIYSFTIKDYTGKLGLGGYLEAWRVINGSSILVERMKAITGNNVPLNLVYGRVYELKMLWGDGSRTNWGYYVPGGDTTSNLIFRGVAFTDRAYTLGDLITVGVGKELPSLIFVDYEDARNGTLWVNMTLRIRNGGIIGVSSSSNTSQTVNFGGLDLDNTGYLLIINGEHTLYGQWSYSKILDSTGRVIIKPDLGDGLTWLGIPSVNLIAFTISTAVLLSYTYTQRVKGMFACLGVSTLMVWIGFATWSYAILWIGAILAFGLSTVVEGKQ